MFIAVKVVLFLLASQYRPLKVLVLENTLHCLQETYTFVLSILQQNIFQHNADCLAMYLQVMGLQSTE